MRQSQLHHRRSCPNGNTPPTSSMSSMDDGPQRCQLRCVYCETDIDETRPANSSSPTRRARPLRPDLAALTARRGRQAQASLIYRSAADALAAGFAPREQRQESARGLRRSPCSRACARPARIRRGLHLRLSVRLDSVRHSADAARRRAGPAHRRLRQYRRHQCAAHRPQGPRRRDACSATCSRAPSAVLIVAHVFGRDAAIVAALGAFLGHLFPVWLNFKGGKGVATYIGLLLGFEVLARARRLLRRSGSRSRR